MALRRLLDSTCLLALLALFLIAPGCDEGSGTTTPDEETAAETDAPGELGDTDVEPDGEDDSPEPDVPVEVDTVTEVDAGCEGQTRCTAIGNVETCFGDDWITTSVCPEGCENGEGCATGADCLSESCVDHVCVAPASCSNEIKDGPETDVDCGGGCPDCADGKGCGVDGDCASNWCDAGTCKAASCEDEIQNGNEGGVDCGGGCPTPCGQGSRDRKSVV